MTFYTQPPAGKIALSKLGRFCHQRLEFLLQVAHSGGSHTAMHELINQHAQNSDCLIEGSRKDAISHFVLRLLCSQDEDMKQMLLKAETLLFTYRFSCMNRAELQNLMTQLRTIVDSAHRWHSIEFNDLLNIFRNLLHSMTINELVERYLDGGSDNTIMVPFEYVLSLVAKRTVGLKKGVAQVPYEKLCILMTILFEKVLSLGVNVAKREFSSTVLQDTRMRNLYREIKATINKCYRPSISGPCTPESHLQHEDIDQLAAAFPPCMASLHQALRSNHRLGHFSRLQYTLFLKELGLPVQEAIHFWRKEYSQPSLCQRDQHHQRDWATNERRYTYSIRHLYGLEGARKNYHVYTCDYTQEMSLASGEEGGCPFRHFDRDHLIRLLSLDRLDAEQAYHILNAVHNTDYTTACQRFMEAQHRSLNKGQEVRVTVIQSQPAKPNTVSDHYQRDCMKCSYKETVKSYTQSQVIPSHAGSRAKYCSQNDDSVCQCQCDSDQTSETILYGTHKLHSTNIGDPCAQKKLKIQCCNHIRLRGRTFQHMKQLSPRKCCSTTNYDSESTCYGKDTGTSHVKVAGANTEKSIKSPLDFYISYKLLQQGLENS